MIRWLDFNDTWLAAEWGHPSDNLASILGLSDWLSRVSLSEADFLRLRFRMPWIIVLSQHFDVATQRQGGQSILGPLLIPPRPKDLTKTNRKTMHLDAAAPGNIEVTKFMDGNQNK